MRTRCVCGYEFNSPTSPTRDNYVSKEEISHSRIILKDISNGIEITIPTKVSPLIFVLSGIGTIVWTIGESIGIWTTITFLNIHDLSNGEILLLILVAIWTIIGVYNVHTWLWYLKGKEIIVLTPSKLAIKKNIWGYGFKRVFDLNRIRNLWLSYYGGGREGNQSGGAILFDYDSNTYRFGLSLTEDEAQFILNELFKRHHFQAG
jgi:hypothetical protein